MTLSYVMHLILSVARYAVLITFAAAVVAAVGTWLLRTRRVSPLSGVGRVLKSVSEPVVKPVELRLVRAGGNPVHAAWWLVIGVAIAGLLFLFVLEWTLEIVGALLFAVRHGPGAVVAFLVELTYKVLVVALFARVIGSWIGQFRYSRWLRPAYTLTDWLVDPIRRMVPPLSGLDLSPLWAWLVLLLVKSFVVNVIL
ncbi:MAG: YggT family protein [Gemmatimonadales bacterium]